MEKMKFETADISQKNIEKIGELFPNCITETKDENGKLKKAINFEMLKQVLSDEIVDKDDERYEFTWVGKKSSIIEANKPIRKTLRPCKEESKDWDNTGNLYIEGDNLQVLKLLQESYLNSIKMIYIDPPYNTGNDFIYNDDFKMDKEEYREESGEIDEEGNRLFKNSETNGRFHSDWCSMMYSRLTLARNLLTDDGVIFISIDDNEQENLKKICNEIFGEKNFVALIPRLTSPQRFAQEKNVNISNDFLLVYKKSDKLNFSKVIIDNNSKKELKKDEIGFYYEGDTKALVAPMSQGYTKNCDYDIEFNGKIYQPVNSKGVRNRWFWKKERMEKAIELGIIRETPNSIRMQIYQDKAFDVDTNTMVEKELGVRFTTLDLMDNKYSNPNGMSDYNKLKMSISFDNPKPLALTKTMLNLMSDESMTILDFFSGERVLIVMGAVNVMKPRVSGTLNKYILCIA